MKLLYWAAIIRGPLMLTHSVVELLHRHGWDVVVPQGRDVVGDPPWRFIAHENPNHRASDPTEFEADDRGLPFSIARSIMAHLGYDLCAPQRIGGKPPGNARRFFQNLEAPQWRRVVALPALKTDDGYLVDMDLLYEVVASIEISELGHEDR